MSKCQNFQTFVNFYSNSKSKLILILVLGGYIAFFGAGMSGIPFVCCFWSTLANECKQLDRL
jgi:hypothetical protein